ncbi:MAG: TSCPD domain-containing protein, partial [Deltaproteobacteria bacterium]|nr:TSCPD domain-containing protein [Deltaproteobacteria bacterium]
MEYVTKKAVHFLDNVIDMNKYPIPQIARMTRGNRKIGLGVMGFAEMLIRLGIPYDSEEAIETGEKIMAFIQEKGREASIELAKKRGVFLNYKGSIYDENSELRAQSSDKNSQLSTLNSPLSKGVKVRNATVTTIAPTGTISIIAGCSSGIEPLFALAFTRNVLDGAALVEVNPLFEEVAKSRGFYTQELAKRVVQSGGVRHLDGIPDDVKRVFVTAHDITPEWHIRMQTAFQKYTDNAVSKTVNFPNEATKEDVSKVYMLAYKLGCKGVTVYRDGSREVQVLNKGSRAGTHPKDGWGVKGSGEINKPWNPGTLEPWNHSFLSPKPREEITFGATRKMKTGCGNLYVTVNEDEEGRPFEVFTQIGKAGGCAASQCEAIGRMVSLALRSGIQPEEVIKQMRGISCHVPVFSGNGGKILSCSDAVARALEWYVNYRGQGVKGTGLPSTVRGQKSVASGQWPVASS